MSLWFEIFISLAVAALLVLALWLVVRASAKFETIDGLRNDVTELRSKVGDIEKFTLRLDASPNYRGSMGEDIVRTLLSDLPVGSVEEQFTGAEIPGRPDFVISLPNVAEKLVVDAKMTIPSDELSDNEYRSRLIRKAAKVSGYIVPGYTFDFALMWIPESAYGVIDNETARRFFDLNVVPVTTPTMLGMIHLLRRAHRAFKLNSLSTEFVSFVSQIRSELKTVQNTYGKAYKQISNGFNNLTQTSQTLLKFDGLIENFEEMVQNDES